MASKENTSLFLNLCIKKMLGFQTLKKLCMATFNRIFYRTGNFLNCRVSPAVTMVVVGSQLSWKAWVSWLAPASVAAGDSSEAGDITQPHLAQLGVLDKSAKSMTSRGGRLVGEKSPQPAKMLFFMAVNTCSWTFSGKLHVYLCRQKKIRQPNFLYKYFLH